MLGSDFGAYWNLMNFPKPPSANKLYMGYMFLIISLSAPIKFAFYHLRLSVQLRRYVDYDFVGAPMKWTLRTSSN